MSRSYLTIGAKGGFAQLAEEKQFTTFSCVLDLKKVAEIHAR